MGPLTLADFIGLDTCLAILNVLHEGLGDPKYRPFSCKVCRSRNFGRKTAKVLYLQLIVVSLHGSSKEII